MKLRKNHKLKLSKYALELHWEVSVLFQDEVKLPNAWSELKLQIVAW